MFHTLGPFSGYSDEFCFMGVDNVYINTETKKEILSAMLKDGDFSFSSKEYIDLEMTRAAGDGLYSLAAMSVKIIEGFHVLEYIDERKYSLSSAKEIFLDGNRFDVVLKLPKFIKLDGSMNEQYGYKTKYHGKFESLEEALSFISKLGVSDRGSSYIDQIDEAMRRGDVIARRYLSPYYSVGDLGQSINEIPPEVFKFSSVEIKKWADEMLLLAQDIKPDVYWYNGTLPLEMRVHKAIGNKKVESLMK